MTQPTDRDLRLLPCLYRLAEAVNDALTSHRDGTRTVYGALGHISWAFSRYQDAVRAPDASAAAAAAEVPDELAPPGWTTTPGGYQVPADLDDDPALWTGEDRSP
ncbi:MAG TPA: hypothetical protein VF174_11500 [Micromonosporaceae bacterium]